ncbi:hypothetical protein [Streptomyces genisteinicus]|uniref:Uncharacterized protein n=1 Tax=Streptomyces genisteinicus TaxID=2768068 RepID=A0A7H0HSL7_9ACTN|nr:hypothetical protein [Streptomyces genisteinicus]QNP63533.1 hypothetical protein IAG43_11725 [Streptomyces genisteinicus]
MHSADVHLIVHRARARDLRAEAARAVPREPIRTRVGWLLVELGLRLVRRPAAHTGRSGRTARARLA